MCYDDASQANSIDHAGTISTADADNIPAGSTERAAGNAISGHGTNLGADSGGQGPDWIIASQGAVLARVQALVVASYRQLQEHRRRTARRNPQAPHRRHRGQEERAMTMIVPSYRRLTVAGLALVTAMTGAVALLSMREPAAAASLTFSVPHQKPADLIAATNGSAISDMQAVGEQAKMINAALPFANEPLRAARRFILSGSDVDQHLALLCLTQAVYYEAGFEPLEGRRAVAQVVLNRLRHPAFPKSICGVVYQGAGTGTCQFTFVCDDALNRRPAQSAWSDAESVARAALSGYVEASVGEATHYHADYVVPRWAPLLAKVAQIGQHIFYRWPGAWGQPAAFTGRYVGEPTDPITMRLAQLAPEEEVDTTAKQTLDVDIPPVPRAPDDVGDLLDTTKGWTLNIPAQESGGEATKATADQHDSSALQVALTSPAAATASK